MQTMRKNRAKCYCDDCVTQRSADRWYAIAKPIIVLVAVYWVISMSGCVASMWKAL